MLVSLTASFVRTTRENADCNQAERQSEIGTDDIAQRLLTCLDPLARLACTHAQPIRAETFTKSRAARTDFGVRVVVLLAVEEDQILQTRTRAT